MPFRKPRNHRHVWVDLLVGAKNASWWKVVNLVYSKGFAYSNYIDCTHRNHQQVREDIYKDDAIKELVKKDPNADKIVNHVLDEMCHLIESSNPVRKIKFAGSPFLKCITKIYSHVYVNNHLLPDISSLEHAAFKMEYLQITKEAPVIILPTHKSYMDFLFISYILLDLEVPLPIVATGDNFKAMGKILTNYLKETGAFLVRRNSQNKTDVEPVIYYEILRAYVHSIILGGENPLEFFMEGTRTRTGQILRPKTGLLSMVVDLYIKNNIDVYILPVSCNYQRPIEEQLYIAETDPQIGIKKPKESARNLLKALETIMHKKYGKVYVRFIEPFKLSQYYSAWKDRNTKLVESDDKDAILHRFTNNLASKVCLEQAYNTVLMPFNLVASSAIFRTFLNCNNNKKIETNIEAQKCNQVMINGNQKKEEEGIYKKEYKGDEEEGSEQVFKLAMKDVMTDFSDVENLLTISQPQFMPGWKSSCDVFEEFLISRDNIIRASQDRRFMEFDSKPNIFFTFLYYSNQVLQMVLPSAVCLLVEDEFGKHSSSYEFERLDYKTIRSLLSCEFLLNDSDLESEIQDARQAVGELRQAACKSAEHLASINRAKSIIMVQLKYVVECYLTFFAYVGNIVSILDSGNYQVDKQAWPQVLDKTKFFSHVNQLNQYISKDMLKNMMVMATETGACTFKLNPRADDQMLGYNCDKLLDVQSKFKNLKSMVEIRIAQYSTIN